MSQPKISCKKALRPTYTSCDHDIIKCARTPKVVYYLHTPQITNTNTHPDNLHVEFYPAQLASLLRNIVCF